ncbi:MAG: DUF3300 domain-containing protein [Planctomycetota bacterium]
MNVCSVTIALMLLTAPVTALQDNAQERVVQGTPTADATKEKTAAAQGATVSKEHLEQLVAPIALYPDSLLAQLLMASTYPLEIVEAARWVLKNPKVTGDKLEAALKDKAWDPSVKSLCGFADVLARMNDNLDWTQDLGDAFLGQKAELMQAVQDMRRKAFDAGNLKSSKELTVTEQSDKIIVIVAAEPEVIYVPTYYPSAVYGSWSYPYWYYPPMYPPPPAGGAWFGFSVGVIWGAAVWGDCDWGHNEVNIDIDRQNNFIDRTEAEPRRQQVKDKAGSAGAKDRAASKGTWQHDPGHRKGVGYKDNKTAQKYGAGPGQTRVSRDQARGYGGGASTSPAGGAAGARDMSGTRPQGSRPATGAAATGSTGQRSGSFSGAQSPKFDRASSARGSASRGSAGARGGGGRGGRR